jgi:hypothetical protein
VAQGKISSYAMGWGDTYQFERVRGTENYDSETRKPERNAEFIGGKSSHSRLRLARVEMEMGMDGNGSDLI